MDRDYDPALDVTAGELRAIGKNLPDSIPDCAWVPRAAMKMGDVRVIPVDHNAPTRSLRAEWDVTFTEPFRWVEVSMVSAPPSTTARCQWCGGELSHLKNVAGARRCLACNKGTIPEAQALKLAENPCGHVLECGGECDLEKGHQGPHLCPGDWDGPGTCVA